MSCGRREVNLLVLGVAVAACATAPERMHYFAEEHDSVVPSVWPPAPEAARLTYAGELIGEENFRREENVTGSAAGRLLRWIAGITGFEDIPTVLIRPQSGMVDAEGRILVTDAGRQAIVVFDERRAELSVWADASSGHTFLSPVGIVADGRDGYLVADAELARLVRLTHDGVPSGEFGRGVLQRPTGLARNPDTGEIFVADTGAHDIKVFDGQGRILRTLGLRGTQPGQFNSPTHLSFGHGRLYVTDTLNSRVQIVSPDGDPLSAIGQRGLFVGNLVRPKGVTTDRDGNVYVVESYYDHLLIFNERGEFLLPLGGTGNGIGQFFLPSGMWSDGDSRLFVADMFNGRVVVFDYLGRAP